MATALPVDFGVYTKMMGEPSACNYYRIQVPMRWLYEMGLSNVWIDKGKLDPTTSAIGMYSSDIIHVFARGGDETNTMLQQIKGMNPGMSDDGSKVCYPPSVVFDMDDNLDWVHPMNPAFCHLGTRTFAGHVLTPGDGVMTQFADGTEMLLWEDKVSNVDGITFDIAENHKRVKSVHETARNCDAVTTTCTYLADYYREVLGCHSVYVFPNSVVPEDYPQVALRPHEGIRILWQGGGSHMVDWYPLRDAVKEICVKYPQVKFLIWGASYKWIHDQIPENQVEFHDWVPYDAYRPMRVLMDADINLCPLTDNAFNRSKSAIKWYEGLMGEFPEPCLAGNAGPYAEEMVDGETGLLYGSPQEFVEKLSALIEREELRRMLGANAKKWVLENRHYSKTVPPLMEFYQTLRARKALALTA